jgi:hypothetical protein
MEAACFNWIKYHHLAKDNAFKREGLCLQQSPSILLFHYLLINVFTAGLGQIKYSYWHFLLYMKRGNSGSRMEWRQNVHINCPKAKLHNDTMSDLWEIDLKKALSQSGIGKRVICLLMQICY